MFALLLFAAFGLAFGYFATLNTTAITISFGSWVLAGIPIYLVIFSSLIIGVIFTTLFYLAEAFTGKRTLAHHVRELSQAKKENTDLVKRNHQLELENTRLKSTYGEVSAEDEVL